MVSLLERSVTHDTVLKLVQPMEGKNHKVYMDNYYTGIPTRELAGLDVEFSHFEFRLAVAKALAKEWEDMGCIYNAEGCVSSPTRIIKVVSAKKAKALLGNANLFRYSSSDYHFSYLEKIPLLEGSKNKYCVNKGCHGHRISKWCRACHAPLCFPKCYKEYHEP
jgi:hypothetical protein